MTDTTNLYSSNHRFSGVLASTPGPRPLCDTVLLEGSEWMATPSLGALVPGWLVVIPRRPALNYSRWAADGGDPIRVLAEAAASMGLTASDYIWFEHGPRAQHTAVGCGVDYAHLHMLIRPPFALADMVASVRSDARLSWTPVRPGEVYGSMLDASYFVIGQGDEAWAALDVEAAGSQYLRRTVAHLLGKPTVWNYREHPHSDNVARTVTLVEALRCQSTAD